MVKMSSRLEEGGSVGTQKIHKLHNCFLNYVLIISLNSTCSNFKFFSFFSLLSDQKLHSLRMSTNTHGVETKSAQCLHVLYKSYFPEKFITKQ